MKRLAFWSALALLAGGFCVAARAAVPITFLPPPLEKATYSLGIYEANSGKLVRHLHEIADESAFTVGTNGLITSWDGKDDSGHQAPPGHYAARGYAVGALKVEGTEILGNDWAAEDASLRVKHCESVALLPNDSGLAVLANMADGGLEVLCLLPNGKLLWRRKVPGKITGPGLSCDDGTLLVWDGPNGVLAAYQVGDGAGAKMRADHPAALPTSNSAMGKNGTTWKIDLESALTQNAPNGSVLRGLAVQPGDPLPREVSASTSEDRLYLLEEIGGWQRIRGLSWVETKEEDGKPVSTWQTFFERNIRTPDAGRGLEGPAVPVEINLVANPLEPGKLQKISLGAAFDDKGSYLTTADGLRLRQISQQPNLRAARLEKGSRAEGLAFFQADAAAWDEFSITGTRNMMAFDAGEFELTAAGEKPLSEKAPEPDL